MKNNLILAPLIKKALFTALAAISIFLVGGYLYLKDRSDKEFFGKAELPVSLFDGNELELVWARSKFREIGGGFNHSVRYSKVEVNDFGELETALNKAGYRMLSSVDQSELEDFLNTEGISIRGMARIGGDSLAIPQYYVVWEPTKGAKGGPAVLLQVWVHH